MISYHSLYLVHVLFIQTHAHTDAYKKQIEFHVAIKHDMLCFHISSFMISQRNSTNTHTMHSRDCYTRKSLSSTKIFIMLSIFSVFYTRPHIPTVALIALI